MMELSKEWFLRDPNNTTITWMAPRVGSGGLVSDNTVLTAAHLTWCVDFPTIHITLSNGIRRRAVLVKEDLDRDLALLRTVASEPLWHGVPPPVFGVFEYLADGTVNCMETAFPRRERRCGPAVNTSRMAFHSDKGNSGSLVYDQAGRLIGIDSASYIGSRMGSGAVFSHARMSLVDATWIEGN